MKKEILLTVTTYMHPFLKFGDLCSVYHEGPTVYNVHQGETGKQTQIDRKDCKCLQILR